MQASFVLQAPFHDLYDSFVLSRELLATSLLLHNCSASPFWWRALSNPSHVESLFGLVLRDLSSLSLLLRYRVYRYRLIILNERVATAVALATTVTLYRSETWMKELVLSQSFSRQSRRRGPSRSSLASTVLQTSRIQQHGLVQM